MFLPHFDVFCVLLLNWHVVAWNLFVLYNNETNYHWQIKLFFISKFFNIPSCQVPIFSYFFLFFGLHPIFSYFFRVLLGTQKHFEIFEIKFPIKLINPTKNRNFMSKKTSLKPLSDFPLKLIPRLSQCFW